MMRGAIPGLRGTLLSPRAADEWLHRHGGEPAASIATAVAQWAALTLEALGPSASERRLLEALEDLVGASLGYQCRRGSGHAVALAPSGEAIALFAFAWARPLTLGSRDVLRAALAADADWAIGFNGVSIGIVDARSGSPRRTASIALEDLAAHAGAAQFAAAVLEARVFSRALADAVGASDRSSLEVREGLREGVQTSLSALTRVLPFDAGLAVLFRLLFVLFAEARSLVPVWHRVYRDHYSLASLASRRPAREPRGTWAALEGARRLLGEGCRAGTLQVAGFNGRLFAPGPIRKWAASAHLDSALDGPASEAIASLVEYHRARGGARQVNYAELDVEELGSIYERVLDLDPAGEGRLRKESGSFYTPRALTEFIVRRTLAPLVAGLSSEGILALRILDPAMGSGAFLVAALRYLTSALERALIDEGTLPEHDVTEADRQHLRRLIAQRCLYGVDVNPMASMLARLSLWLATLAASRPLGFLDHRLKCGNSLVGIDPATARLPPGRSTRSTPLPLFDAADAAPALRGGAAQAADLARMREDTLEEVRRKQKVFAALTSDDRAIARWRRMCDAWCAWWFLGPASRPDAREYRALADSLLRDARVLARRNVARRVHEVAAVASAEHFFHWPLEFPDVFNGAGVPGFDAVIGNPPWEMLRAEAGSASRGGLNAFARGSGAYTLATNGHLNLYQLFMERSLQLTRQGGRIGMILPWGLMTDDGSARLREALFDGTRVETLARFDNRDGAFQAHRSLRFAAVTAGVGEATEAFEVTRVDQRTLDDLPDTGMPGRGPVLKCDALSAIGGRGRRVPDAGSEAHLSLALKLVRRHRALGDPAGWGASFGRELNLTDDRASFSRAGLPVLEGKHLHPFRVDAGSVRHRISAAAASRLLRARPFDRSRLAYRDVTAATNRQTLIAAIVPAGMVTSHSLFCLRNAWDGATQHALCVILNSSVANFLIRLFVASHVTTSLMEWLPVPDRAASVRVLGDVDAGEAADALVARLYGLAGEERETI